MQMVQKTITREMTLQGIGVHLGKPATVTLKPAPAHHGIVFVRKDLPNSPAIEAHYRNVVNTQMATTLGSGGVTLSTTEHLLAALHGFGIDNLLVEVNGPELPILDGSSAPFCRAILEAGVTAQNAPRTTLVLKKKVEVKVDEKWAVAEPSPHFEVFGSIDWDHPLIGFQQFHYIEGKTDFAEIASARTFGFLKDVEKLKKLGLALGGSLDNAVVLNEALVLNPEGLRYPDEFARHKVLDSLGDFKLAGIPIQAKFKMHRAGHDLHKQILLEIFKDASNYEIVEGVREARPETKAKVAALGSYRPAV